MKIFLAGGSGAVGKRLVPLLVRSGHQVVATTRSASKSELLRKLGAEPAIVDGLDREAVMRAVQSARPDAVIHQMTSLTHLKSLKHLDRELAATNRLRTEGTEHLIAAARAAGARRFIAQSYIGWPYAREGGPVKSEEDPLDPAPPAAMRTTVDAIKALEREVLAAADLSGVVLRYGWFYGPGTSIAQDGDIPNLIRRRRMPIVGNGGGIWSFVHMDDVALTTAIAVERGHGLFNIVDDEPAAVAAWLPELASILGAPPPRRVPEWLARFAIGEAGVVIMTSIRGASNAKAKRELGWQPLYPSWREGFRQEFVKA